MGVFDWLSKSKNIPKQTENAGLQMLSFYTPMFAKGKYEEIYESDLVRAAIHSKAKFTAKLKPEVTGSALGGIGTILKSKPNPLMTTYDFLYRLRTIYEVDTCAFIIPLYGSDYKTITGFYPLKSQGVEIVSFNNTLYLRYQFPDGTKAAIEYDRVGVLAKMNYRNELFGDGNSALSSTMGLIEMHEQGINEGIKNSASIRFMASLSQSLMPEDLEEERRNFSLRNLTKDNQTGVLLYDAKYKDVKQIENKPFVIDSKQMDYIKNSIFSYLGVNDDVLQNKFDENTWNAFYEGEIETFAIQLGLALTNMVSTTREQTFGNEVYFSSNRLLYASNTSKLQATTQLFDRGIFGEDDVAEAWGMPKTGLNRKYIRKEYAEIGKDPIDATLLANKEKGGDEDEETSNES